MKKIKVIFFICFSSFISSQARCQTIFSDNGKYGIMDDGSKKIVVPAEYDKITAGSKSESFGTEEFEHSFILKKNEKYYFVLKKWWSTSISKESVDGWNSYPPLESEDSVEWEFFNHEFDTLYRFEDSDAAIHYKDMSIQDFEIHFGDTCFEILKYTYPIIYRKGENYGLLTFERASRTFGSYVKGNLRFTRIEYSIENIDIYPTTYDKITFLRRLDNQRTHTRGEDLIITSKNGKYGIINLQDNYEIAPQFDSIPSRQVIDYDRFFYAKKNGLWGVIYLNKYSSDYVVSIPFRFASIDDITRNLQRVSFYKRRILKNGKELEIQLQGKYISCLYQSGIDQPLQFEFIIYGGESFSRTILNETTKKEKLNKDYIPQKEKHVTFVPLINNNQISQQKEHEYVCITKPLNHLDDTTLMFFVLKRNRNGERNDEHYRNEQIEAKAIYIYNYDFSKNIFVSVNDFSDETPTDNFKLISEHLITEDWREKPTHFGIELILKSTLLESSEYKYEFFTIEGKKVYELISKYLINDWEFVQKYDSGNLYYMTPDVFVLKFYSEIPGKKKTKKKTVCHYNIKTQQFYN